jgi:hypothetical protein
MAKLHELLAVDSTLRGQAETTRSDLMVTFQKKGHHFTKKLVTYKPLAEGLPEKTEAQLDIQTTVADELAWIGDKVAKAVDVGYQIDLANTKAVADIVLEDGVTIVASAVPATALLQIEKRLGDVMDLIKSVPTLDPAKGFGRTPDPTQPPGIYRARDEVRVRTEKVVRPLVLYPATDKHPAQVQALSTDEPTGHLVTQEWSSLIHSADKGAMLDRVEELTRAVKKARSKANNTEVDNTKIGAKLLGYIFGPLSAK